MLELSVIWGHIKIHKNPTMIFLKNFWGLAKPVFHTNIYIWNISWITNIIIVHLLEMFRHNRSFLVLKVYYLFVAAFLNYKSSETPNNMISLIIQQRGALNLYRRTHTSSYFWKKCIFCVLEIYFFHQINIYTFILKMRNSKNK